MVLTVEDLTANYGTSQILFGVDLHVEKGEVVGLLGRNGAGKTTTLKCIAGVTPPEKTGTVTFEDETISDLPAHTISQHGIKLVPEDRDVIPTLTVEENLRLGGLRADVDVEERLEHVYDVFPRVEERKENRGDQLSGGEEQMVAIGRALMSDPQLLLLDEPTEGLAPTIVQDVIDVIQELKTQGYTTMIVEQNLKAALELTERNYILQQGDVVFESDTQTLEERDDVTEQYLGVS